MYRRLPLVLSFCLLLLCALPTSAAETEAKATVEKLHSALLETMQEGAQLGFAGRAAKLAPTLAATFDFETISRLATGRYWAQLPADKKREFIEVFTRLSTATYAENFKSFGGERFATRATEDKKTAQLVKTVLIKTDGKEVSLNYLLANDKGKWRIVNVVAQGVSDLSLKRAEYTAVIGSTGIDTLIAKLNAKVASYGH
jgi:phospholipid transport system substrate-binding protein